MKMAIRPLLRLTFPWNAVLGAPAMIIVPLIAVLTRRWTGPLSLAAAYRLLELVSSAAAIVAFAHLMVIDSEERALELRFTYPSERWTLVAERLVPAVVVLLLGAVGGWAALRAAVPDLGLGASLAAVFPPALALTAAAFLAGSLTANTWVAGAVPLAWWGLAFITSRAQPLSPLMRFLVRFHLFQTCRPVMGVDYSANRWLLLFVAAICLVACALRVSRRESWVSQQ